MKRIFSILFAILFLFTYHTVGATPLPDLPACLRFDATATLCTDITVTQKSLGRDFPTPFEMESVIPEGIDFSKVKHSPVSIYKLPYSLGYCNPQWHRLWVNTAVLGGAFVSTLFVLECLPEDATSWNRAEIQSVPLFKRWYQNIFVKNPEWDHDNAVFNYILHPYAGAVYFMSARSCGFNFYQSMLYSACISTVCWEFGIEAFMERPSYQDLFITPVFGSIIGELFYQAKRSVVSHGYRLAGSPVLGHAVAFLVDPVNEVIDLFRGSPEHDYAKQIVGERRPKIESSLVPNFVGSAPGFTLSCRF